MKNLKWILITLFVMIITYALINAIISFATSIFIGSIAAVVVLIVIGYKKLKDFINRF